MSYRLPVAAGKQKGDNIVLGILCYLALAVLALGTVPLRAQRLDNQITALGGAVRIERPSSMAMSPGGEKIAIGDLATNRIVVVDLQGRPLWVAGEQVTLSQPGAICFESESRVFFVPEGSLTILAVSEEDVRAVDTVVELTGVLDGWRAIDQIVRVTNSGGYLLLSRSAGEVALFDTNWKFKEISINHGSGKGKLLAPSALALTATGKVIATDYSNFPVQFFASDGKFLLYGGWNQPSQERGWEASAVAVDTRDHVWVADETNGRFRIFDQSGTIISTIPFANPAVRPVAMAGTIDNRMAILEQTGALLFYTLE